MKVRRGQNLCFQKPPTYRNEATDSAQHTVQLSKRQKCVQVPQLEASYQDLCSYYSSRNTGGDGMASKQDQKELQNIRGDKSNSVQTV